MQVVHPLFVLQLVSLMQLVKLRGLSKHELPKPNIPDLQLPVDGDVQRQVWRGGSREGSGRDAVVLLMLQRA